MMMMMMMILLLFREEDLLRKINKSSSLSGIERSCNRRILGCLVGYQHCVLRNKYLPVLIILIILIIITMYDNCASLTKIWVLRFIWIF